MRQKVLVVSVLSGAPHLLLEGVASFLAFVHGSTRHHHSGPHFRQVESCSTADPCSNDQRRSTQGRTNCECSVRLAQKIVGERLERSGGPTTERNIVRHTWVCDTITCRLVHAASHLGVHVESAKTNPTCAHTYKISSEQYICACCPSP